MLQFIFVLASLASFANVVDAECANGCNGHGKCTSYDMCICNRNWQANDCSERTCLFGTAHVDSPKGDLDMSGALSGPDAPIVDNSFNYPYGTTEQFPQMEDSDLQALTNSAHYYMECSNKGTCNRASGECQCYEGYDGVACQRASCPGYPNSCSGHGVCKTIQQLANSDSGNVYKLWDKDITMGCECDSSYYGPDCSLRTCKSGVDPLYLDDAATVRYSTWDLAVLTKDATAAFTDGQSQQGTGTWAIRFFDNAGEDWLTGPLNAGADCATVIAALEALPNNVIHSNTVLCTYLAVENVVESSPTGELSVIDTEASSHLTDLANHAETIWYRMAMWEWSYDTNYGEISPDTALAKTATSADMTSLTTISGYIYRLKFYGNPGKLREPEIEVHLDGMRPTLINSNNNRVLTKVWTDGQQGEDIDYFADHCDGVTATISGSSNLVRNDVQDQVTKLVLSASEKLLLMACLGDSDFDTSNNVDVYNWDHGTEYYPHIIKLVRTVTTYTDGGYYAVLYFDGTDFILVNPFVSSDNNYAQDIFDIYTTKGTLALTSNRSEATFGYASRYVYMSNISYDMAVTDSAAPYDGDISCEIGNNNAYKFQYIFHCLNKTDMFTMLDWVHPHRNPRNINLYTAQRLYTTPYAYSVQDRFDQVVDQSSEMHFMTHVITTDISTNWGAVQEIGQGQANANALTDDDFFRVYKFFPAPASQYEYVAECSNRGICDTSAGECKCFSGYTSDNCGEQVSVAC